MQAPAYDPTLLDILGMTPSLEMDLEEERIENFNTESTVPMTGILNEPVRAAEVQLIMELSCTLACHGQNRAAPSTISMPPWFTPPDGQQVG